MNVICRAIERDDIASICKLFQGLQEEGATVSFVDDISPQTIEKWIEDPNVSIFVALDEKQVVGVFRAKRGGKNKEHSAFLTVAVNPEYRGCKLAKRLTLFSLEKLRELGIKVARAYVYSDNKASINTLLSTRFTLSGCVYQHHYDEKAGEYVDDLIFHKIL
ncbi:GCN5-related N-acetyltransferase [Alkaliphilus metalliredigens QYMF]|uniref:GCN5-related N-acetyltransferase n=1 Tax=Alkaliphilus metalliredigens (strain QYMF) TaxID=293826 RepID=A6TNY2_ALKMQ|nr:GNAT family N-acetyltransferase [Alkaliphilus metalliredigens]ABR47900.1 GCN5-related N-acetyltransferase [Alkaliphilus metalliredigens QYMF]